MQIVPWVALGGALGAVGRWAVTALASHAWGDRFPYGTFLVNVIGSLLLGMLVVVAARSGWSDGPRMMITTGVLGAFTTFSTFSVETVVLLERGEYGFAAVNVVANLAACLVAAGLGLAVARGIWP